ncbi:SusC/RagA family TonB-linked outer membrane protein [Riemerella anatipestifer]|uniref:SusC/RagA family TonB-linked outer membrane protein n=1 Tax=Riemerella anatipestifer TaxID=34085 RepID=UPI0007EDF678|nr:SusC/RagA family TonB-linked outer membrane protein [Riemerella anatipestifer]AZZ58181.1 SusC/RagA family TonB-linked outer membrane protein [Riemerella anatipestifer]MCO7318155.1 SusC/RagA family TonB-linked outer membrane protein [Riemerella anatipestifer]MCQ4154404.1 SusC/RagA family TonB-linked outer membrane protein [Riemerella anatipestifer]MCQ4180396.1 SusC/RagA family TonB-linked outer membrane protein [Riemerella anatipestifer]MCW0473906.1 SusC/RagA family TonB-linked outer membran
MKTKLLLTLLPGVFFAQNTITDTVQNKERKIEEVVLTGFQKIEKSKLTSSVGVVKMKSIEQKATASVDQMLQGKVAGVMITPASGTPGQIAPVRVRGTASLSGSTDPLWVVDGMPLEGNQAPAYNVGQDINELKNYSIAGFNPEDIEDITVLKDASATAIYGARAANGVILVTTKSGKKGRMSINFSSNTFVSLRPDFSRLNLMNASQKVDMELMMAERADLDNYRKDNGAVSRILTTNNDWDSFRNGGFSALSPLSQKQINELRNTNTNWGNLLYRNVVNQQQAVSITGGLDNYSYYASFGYYDEKSTVIGSGFNRFNLTLKNNYKVSDKLNLGLSIFGTSTKQTSFLSDSGSYTTPTYYSRTANPYLAPRDANGNYIYDRDINYVESFSGNDTRIPYNYIEERENTRYSLANKSLRTILDVNYKIIKDLEYRSQFGLLIGTGETERYASAETYLMRRRIAESIQSATNTSFLPNGDYFQRTNSNDFEYNFRNILEYSPRFVNHDLNVLAGSEIRRTRYYDMMSQMYGYNPKTKTSVPVNLPDSQATSPIYTPNRDTEVENSFASFFGTLSYTYAKKYTFFGSVRYDGTNFFGAETNKRWNPIWAASVAWNVKNENFLKDNATISMFKLRGSYGLQGNIDRGTSPYFRGTYGNTRILNTAETTIVHDGAPNPLLRWERTATKDVGLDFGLWNNRVNFTLDLYERKGTDIMGVKELPLETGFSLSNVNWASLTNRGFEFSLITNNINTNKFKWTTTFNISANRSNIDEVNDGRYTFLPSGKGYPVNAVFGIKTAGLDANGLPLFYDKSGNVVSAVDFYKISDPWGIGYVASEYSQDQMKNWFSYLGDRDPKYFGGITNTFNIGNWDLNIAASFNIKQTVLGRAPYNFTAIDRGLNASADILNAWTPNNTTSTLPRIIGADTVPGQEVVYGWFANWDPTNSYNYFDLWAKEMSFIRINNIRLGYNLPADLLKSAGIKSMRLSLEGRNLLVFSNGHKNFFDPETYGNIYAQPIQKALVFGLNVGF